LKHRLIPNHLDRANDAYFNTVKSSNIQSGGQQLSHEPSNDQYYSVGDSVSDREGSNFRQTMQAGVRSAVFFNTEELLKGSQHKQAYKSLKDEHNNKVSIKEKNYEI